MSKSSSFIYPTLSYFAELISTRRSDLDLTLYDIASSVGVSISTIHYWEAGNLQRLPRPADFNTLCKVLDLDALDVIRQAGYDVQDVSTNASRRRIQSRQSREFKKVKRQGQSRLRRAA